MADIRQAAKWMDEGKSVGRKDLPPPPNELVRCEAGRISINGEVVCRNHKHQAVFTTDDLLADDWEIAP